MLDYAAGDVKYLPIVYDIIKTKITEKGISFSDIKEQCEEHLKYVLINEDIDCFNLIPGEDELVGLIWLNID